MMKRMAARLRILEGKEINYDNYLYFNCELYTLV